MKTTLFTPKPTVLYIGDNGRIHCGEHLGHTARTTGRDLSGETIIELTSTLCGEFVRGTGGKIPRCELCGREPATITYAPPTVLAPLARAEQLIDDGVRILGGEPEDPCEESDICDGCGNPMATDDAFPYCAECDAPAKAVTR